MEEPMDALSLAQELQSLESETFEIQDYAEASEMLIVVADGSTSSSSCSTSSSTTSTTSCCA
jgi:thiazolylpeptide-type bacteriocin precursor